MLQIKSIFTKLEKSRVVKTSILSILLIMSFSIPTSFNANAQVQCSASINDLQDSNYRGPVFLDSYWTDQSVTSTSTGNIVKKEVGPGEGPSTLAVVLVNRSPDDIINVQGVLDLPSGFVVAGTSGDPSTQNILKTLLRTGATNPAVSSYGATVPSGATFTMYFDINVLKNAKTGLKPSNLVLSYYTTSSFQSCFSALLTVPFFLPGKVILDAQSNTPNLIPNQPNTLSISLINRGSADATGVVATIVSLGDTNTRGSSSSGSVVLNSATTQLVNLGSNSFNVGTIPANGRAIISTTVFPSSATSGTTQTAQIQISYGNAYGYVLSSSFGTGLVVSPDTNTPTLNISYSNKNTSPLLTAGKLEDLNFTITNNSNSTLSNIIISLTPPSSSISVVGDSKWTLERVNPGETKELSTKVFAATSLIDTPTSFSVGANYISNGVSKSDSLNLGAFVIGDITIQVHDISLTNVGNTPTLTGTLLNQGSTTGLFTTVQLLHPELLVGPQNNTQRIQGQFSQGGQGQFSQGIAVTRPLQTSNSTNTPQYIGDLTANSPTPFSIPLSGTVRPGTHQVSFKIIYADELKHFHELTLGGTINVSQPPAVENVRHGTSLGGGMLLYLPITGASAVIATFFVMKKRNSSKNKIQKNNKDIDIESLLDDSTSDKK